MFQYSVATRGSFDPEVDRVANLALCGHISRLGMIQLESRPLERFDTRFNDIVRSRDVFCEVSVGG